MLALGALLVVAALTLFVIPWGGGETVLRPPVRCNDAQRIAIGELTSGELWATDLRRDGRLTDFYSFVVRDRDYLEIVMESDQLDSYLQLFDENMAEITIDDDSGDGSDARIARFIDPGCYVIGAESYTQDDGGAYRLTLRFMPQVPDQGIWVTGLRLFEGPSQLPAYEDREYDESFPASSARYINVELGLAREESGTEATFTVECVMLREDGTEKGRFEWSPRMESDWTSSYSASGWGQETPAWVAGTYRVTCTSGGVIVAERFFDVT